MIPKRATAFVMMPFTEETKPVRDAIRNALDTVGIVAILIDEVPIIDTITDEIENHIRNANVCICDISSRNPNVAWEFGYASALGKKIIMIASNIKDLYFDIQNKAAIIYETNNLELLTQRLIRKLNSLGDSLDFRPHDLAISNFYKGIHLTASASTIQHTPYECFDLIAKAKKHILLAGQNHGFVWQSERNKNRFKQEIIDFLTRSSDAQFDVMICNDCTDHAVKTWEYINGMTPYREHLAEAILYFQELTNFFGKEVNYKGRFTVKKLDFVPLSIMFVDPKDDNTGLAVVTPNGFHRGNNNKPCFILSRKNDQSLIDAYWNEYYHFFTAMPSTEFRSVM